ESELRDSWRKRAAPSIANLYQYAMRKNRTSKSLQEGFPKREVAIGASRQKFRLDIEDFHQVLLSEYSGIKNERDALQFIEMCGFPIEQIGNMLPVHEVLETASFLRWLLELTRVSREDPSLRRYWITIDAGEFDVGARLVNALRAAIRALPDPENSRKLFK